jgi:hypothetical protein
MAVGKWSRSEVEKNLSGSDGTGFDFPRRPRQKN